MTEHTVQRAFFFALLFAVTLAFVWLIRGFLQPIFWAVALGIVVFPLHEWLLRKLEPRESLAALASVLLVVLIVVLPLIGIAAAVTSEAAALYQRLSTRGTELAGVVARAQEHVPQIVAALERLGVDPARLESQVSSAAVTASQFIASRALSIGQDTLRIAIFFVLMLYLLFFFLRDGRRLLESLVRALPLGDHRERHLLERFAEVSRATIKGTVVVGAVQGAIGGIAFAVVGVGAPVLWGVMMALLSILPAVGPSLVWAPAAIILFVNGEIVGGIVLLATGLLVIGLIDNLLRPILVGRDTRMPDYLILLSTLGGLTAFGLSGIIIGPIIAAFFLSTWQMAEHELDPKVSAQQETNGAAQSGPRAAEPILAATRGPIAARTESTADPRTDAG